MDAQTRRFTRVSGGAEAMLGYPLERWHGVPGFWIGILHPDDRERVARAIWRALREHRPCQIEYRAIASDGTVVRLRDRVQVTRDATGTLLLQGSIVDLTERAAVIPSRRRRGRRRFHHELRAGLPGMASGHLAFARPPAEPIGEAGAGVAEAPARELAAVPAVGEGVPGVPVVPPGREGVPEVRAVPPVGEGVPEVRAVPEGGEGVHEVDGAAPPIDWRFPFEAMAESEQAAAGLSDVELSLQPGPVVPGPGREATEPAEAVAAVRILHALSEAVIASDADHRVVYWSPAAESLLGWTSAETIGREDAELLRTRATAGQTTAIIEGLLGRRPWSAEVEVQNRDGEDIPVRIGAAALHGESGQLAGYVAVVTDLRDARASERRRSSAATMDAVARLARGIGEELSRGVERIETALRGVLVRVPGGAADRAGLDEALRGVDSTAALAAELRSTGRRVPPQPGLVHLHDLVQRSLPAVRLLVPSGVEVRTETEPAARPAAADPATVSQVLMNLVAGASTAVRPDGVITVRISNETLTSREAELLSSRLEAGEWVVLEVIDDRGPVPAESELDRAFEPFHELSQSPPGLGLAAAHGLVAGCGGVLVARAAPHGVAFKAYLRPASTRAG